MVSERDLRLYVIAVKSLLRFCPPMSVIVHSDGTLTRESIDRLKRHIPGCQIVDAPDADARAAATLGSNSLLSRYRCIDVSYRRLIDSELWTTTRKRIMMDSDVLVLRRPARLIEWILGEHQPFLFGNPEPHTTVPTVTDSAREHVQTIFRSRLPEISDALGRPKVFLQNAGACLYGCTGELGLSQIERLICTALDLGVPMQRWGGEQCVVNYLLATSGATALDPERCVDFHPDNVDAVRNAAIVHFPVTYRFHRNVYARLARGVVRDLALSPAPIVQLD